MSGTAALSGTVGTYQWDPGEGQNRKVRMMAGNLLEFVSDPVISEIPAWISTKSYS